MIKEFQDYLIARRPDIKFGCAIDQLPEITQRIVEGDAIATELATRLSASDIESTGGGFHVSSWSREDSMYDGYANPEGQVTQGLLPFAESGHYHYLYHLSTGLVSMVAVGAFDADKDMEAITGFTERTLVVIAQYTLPEFFEMATKEVTRWLDKYDECIKLDGDQAKAILDEAIKAAKA